MREILLKSAVVTTSDDEDHYAKTLLSVVKLKMPGVVSSTQFRAYDESRRTPRTLALGEVTIFTPQPRRP